MAQNKENIKIDEIIELLQETPDENFRWFRKMDWIELLQAKRNNRILPEIFTKNLQTKN